MNESAPNNPLARCQQKGLKMIDPVGGDALVRCLWLSPILLIDALGLWMLIDLRVHLAGLLGFCLVATLCTIFVWIAGHD